MISVETATDIAMTHREIEVAEKLLADVDEVQKNNGVSDIRDCFGRVQNGLELGVPSGGTSRRIFNVPWPMAKIIIEGHIAASKTRLQALNEKARIELGAS